MATSSALLSLLRLNVDIPALDYDLHATLKHDKENIELPRILLQSQSANSVPPIECQNQGHA